MRPCNGEKLLVTQLHDTYLRKFREHSVATALASNVLPVPGGPYNSTPVKRYYVSLNLQVRQRQWATIRIAKSKVKCELVRNLLIELLLVVESQVYFVLAES